jgi:SNF2 family DNA or RNA helicase
LALVREHNGQLALHCPYEDKDRAKRIAGYRWDAAAKAWLYPATAQHLDAILKAFPGITVYPSCYDAIARRSSLLNARHAEDGGALPPVRGTPYRHQLQAYRFALSTLALGGGVALLMEQGTGKTLCAIGVAGRLFLDGQIQRLLVVCPKSVMPVWQDELRKWADFPYCVRVLDHADVRDRIRDLIAPWPSKALNVCVLNYESTWRMEQILKQWATGQFVIADESQRIKTPGARQSRAMHQIGFAAKYRAILTGTPITQGPLDVWSQYRFCDSRIFEPRYTDFKTKYAVVENNIVRRYRNLEELTEKVHSIAFRVRKSECLDLPPEVDQTIYVKLQKGTMEVYEDIRDKALAELDSMSRITAANILVQLLRLQQVAGGFVNDDDGTTHQVGTEKLEACMDLLDDLLSAQDRKVVVFCNFVPELLALSRECKSSGIRAALLYGDTPQDERARIQREFASDGGPHVLICQIRTGGVGLNLQRADTAVFYSTGWSLESWLQARGRIHRPGQTADKVQYFSIVAKNTVDEDIHEALAKKEDLATTITDKWRSVLRGAA